MSVLRLFAATATALLFGYVFAGCSTTPRSVNAASVKSEKERKPAPDFTLKDSDGKPVRLADYKGKVVLLDFWATWCSPCRAIAPIVEELATEFQGKVKIGKMDVDSNSATPMRYKVTGIPTLLVFKGGQVVEQLVGYRPKDAIAQALNKHLG